MLFPTIIVGLAATIASTNIVTGILNKEIKNQLNAASMVGIEYYQNNSNTDYFINVKGVLCKGVFQISGDSTVVDRIKEYSGIEAGFYYDDKCIATTWKDKDGKQMLENTLSKEVYTEVIKNGKPYFVTDKLLNSERYYGLYQPIKQPSSGEVVAAFFTGKPTKQVKDQISQIRNQIFLLTVIVLVVTTIVVTFIINFIIRALRRTVKDLGSVAEGELTITECKSFRRKDEISEIAIATVKLRESLRKVIGQIISSIEILKNSADKLNIAAKQTHSTVTLLKEIADKLSSEVEVFHM